MISIITESQIPKLNAAKNRWLQITGYAARVSIVKRCLPDFREFDPEIAFHWSKATRIYQERVIKPREELLLRPLTPARQKWVKTTGLKASLQSVIDVLPECSFSLNTERDWLLVTSIYVKRYPEKVLVQNSEIEVVEKDDTVIKTSPLSYKQHDFRKVEPPTSLLPIISLPTPVATPSTPKDPAEQRMSNKLAGILGGIREASNPSGRVDVLTKLYVIEVKKACNWKHGIGQALVYQFYYPDKKAVLFLFGEDVNLYRDLAKQHCDRLGVLYREESQQMSEEF
ncbi:hypothetical protein [Nostoc sp. MG11]|uniref:hypothetical protein n=1 Tax=Nostoc sp. MG11 TaxID=2721166 RepID=UPI001865E5F0|nr:hypothetical protein [Nostoc sp. MG11]